LNHPESISELGFGYKNRSLMVHGENGAYFRWDLMPSRIDPRIRKVVPDELKGLRGSQVIPTSDARLGVSLSNSKSAGSSITSTTRLFNLNSGVELGGAIEPGESQVWVSPKGRFVGFSARRWTVRRLLSEASFGRQVKLPDTAQDITIDKNFVLVHLENGQYQAFDGSSGETLGKPFPPREIAASAGYPLISPDRAHVVLAHGEDAHYSSRIWNVTSGTEVGRFGYRYIGGRSAFSPDGKFLYSAEPPNLLHVLDARSGKEIGEPMQTNFGVWNISMNSAGSLLAVHCKVLKPQKPGVKPGAEWDEMIQFWDLPKRELVAERRPDAGGWETLRVSFAPNGKAIIVWRYKQQPDDAGHNPMMTEIWDCETLRSIRLVEADLDQIEHIQFSPDGRVAIATTGTKIAFLDPSDWRLLGEPLPAPGHLDNIAFSPDGRTFIADWDSRGSGRPNSKQRWDLLRREPLGEPFVGDAGNANVWAISADGRCFAVLANGGVSWFEATSGKRLASPIPFLESTVSRPTLDGRSMVLIDPEGNLRLYSAPVPLAGSPQRLSLWVKVITGMELTEAGDVRPLSAEIWRDFKRQLEQIGGPPEKARNEP
jgi:WD40 repeat protein